MLILHWIILLVSKSNHILYIIRNDFYAKSAQQLILREMREIGTASSALFFYSRQNKTLQKIYSGTILSYGPENTSDDGRTAGLLR